MRRRTEESKKLVKTRPLGGRRRSFPAIPKSPSQFAMSPSTSHVMSQFYEG